MNKLNVVNECGGISARAKTPVLSMRENFHLTLVCPPPVQTLGVGERRLS